VICTGRRNRRSRRGLARGVEAVSDHPRKRLYWVPQVRDPAAPTAEEIAAAVPLGDVVDGLQVLIAAHSNSLEQTWGE
jgi:hypothetical protein